MQRRAIYFGGGQLTPAVRFLIIANSIIFLFTALFSVAFIKDFTFLFGLVPIFVYQKLFIWQFITYMFLHGSLTHLLFNMLVLWMFGSDIERLWGSREFILYYLICGIGAGLFNFAFHATSLIPIIGSSGAIYGILMAFAIFYGYRELYFMFMFPIKAGAFIVMIGLIELLSSIVYTQSGIAHLAHLGGLLFGFIYISVRFNRGWTDLLRLWHQYQTRRKIKKFYDQR